mgnify:CR=1 FL=1
MYSAMVTSTHNFVAHQLMNLRKGWMQRFVKPMVFGNTQINWEEAYSSFRQTALSVLTS